MVSKRSLVFEVFSDATSLKYVRVAWGSLVEWGMQDIEQKAEKATASDDPKHTALYPDTQSTCRPVPHRDVCVWLISSTVAIFYFRNRPGAKAPPVFSWKAFHPGF